MNQPGDTPLPDALARYVAAPGAAPRPYPDLHAHVLELARRGLLCVVDEPINKDTEMHPLVRWQYRGGIAETARKAFLFTQPIDSHGRRYNGAVLVGGLAATPDVYRVGFGKPLEQIGDAWVRAIAAPLAPNLVERAPCHDIVTLGAALDEPGAGLDGLPVPISTPGWDNAPYLSAGHYITKDPDTGVQNVGNYRGQLKAPRRLGMNPSVELRAGIYSHWLKYKARGEPMPCAVVVGCPPAVSYTAVQKLPEGVDELAVAGALAGAPIDVVRAQTVDLLVPADAEYVIEGFISTEWLEPEAPFGESHGYVNLQEYNAFMDVTAITRRHAPILTSFISQVTPSESSVIRRVAMEPVFLNHLRTALGIRGVKRVSMHEPLTSLYAVIAVQFERGVPETEVWRALYGASTLHRFAGKWIVAIDEDIDPANADALFWAMSYRCQPQHDLRVLDHKDPGHGPRGPRDDGASASVLINALLKEDFAPVALPKREFMEHARRIWERLGLPALTPQAPWHGYDLGAWPAHLEAQAQAAARSDYFSFADALVRQRRADMAMNQPLEGDRDEH
ncbi:UbiD family decarboxylase [Paraburkholderia sp. SARCC-3016]|uniref:UbiD family decarboxylase n=1 Tax=Paraburkholderia sp. SARCC-3016 TaxID=3058611 RepID=UPI0028084986|nr:UbiD family decarboxylase [Paraburkholderia sp. SARCC-3016]MDQ7978833.1 UbiD family decarboxylase [Paraburkholderia sp. SARCC-3016]